MITIDKLVLIIISSLALIISIISYLKAHAISNANLEINIYNMIRNSKLSLYEASRNLISEETDDSKRYILTKKLYDSLIEDLVSSYEEACTKYLDKKVDLKRFEKNFKHDILKLVEDEEVIRITHINELSGKKEYGALIRVYEEWFGKEN